MQALSKRERNLVIVCAVFLIAVVIFVMSPSGKALPKHKLLPTDRAETEWRKAAKTYQTVGASMGSIQPRVSKMTYSESPDTVAALATQELQDIAARSHIHLREVKPQLRVGKMKSSQIGRVSLDVRFRAPFQPDVVRFLYYIEDPTGRMVVDKVDITSADSRFKSVEVTARVSVFTQSVTGTTGTAEGDSTDGT